MVVWGKYSPLSPLHHIHTNHPPQFPDNSTTGFTTRGHQVFFFFLDPFFYPLMTSHRPDVATESISVATSTCLTLHPFMTHSHPFSTHLHPLSTFHALFWCVHTYYQPYIASFRHHIIRYDEQPTGSTREQEEQRAGRSSRQGGAADREEQAAAAALTALLPHPFFYFWFMPVRWSYRLFFLFLCLSLPSMRFIFFFNYAPPAATAAGAIFFSFFELTHSGLFLSHHLFSNAHYHKLQCQLFLCNKYRCNTCRIK